MNNKFWKNKNILITGFEGFLGSHLTSQLLRAPGVHIVGLDIRVKRRDTIFNPKDYRKITVVRGSVSDYPLIKDILNKNKIDIIFHLAASALVEDCLKSPLVAFSTNIRGTWSLLEAGSQSPSIEAIIIASSDKAYGKQERLPYRETDALCGSHPYDVSKSCADLLAYTY